MGQKIDYFTYFWFWFLGTSAKRVFNLNRRVLALQFWIFASMPYEKIYILLYINSIAKLYIHIYWKIQCSIKKDFSPFKRYQYWRFKFNYFNNNEYRSLQFLKTKLESSNSIYEFRRCLYQSGFNREILSTIFQVFSYA